MVIHHSSRIGLLVVYINGSSQLNYTKYSLNKGQIKKIVFFLSNKSNKKKVLNNKNDY